MRTKEQVLKDFLDIGWQFSERQYVYIFTKSDGYYKQKITINVNTRTYSVKVLHPFEDGISSPHSLKMEEHKLLHELFEILGWL